MLGKAKRIASTLAATLLFTFVTVASGYAQGTTGKIQGRVVSSTGQPISSAQVTVDGTNLGNITNDDGFYFVNQVPAGLHTVRAQSIGYRTVAISNQRVLAGQTTTLNFNLDQAAVALEALVVTGERNPLVPRDQVSSKAIVTGETIDELPLDNSASIILLQPGIVETNGGNGGFSIRGSREGEHAVYVDGVPVRSLRSGTAANLELPTNALAQVDVTTGGIAARYGNAQSGLVNYVTKTGAASLGGTVSFQTTEFSPKAWGRGFNRAELSIGGPLLMDNLSFFVGGTAQGNRTRNLNQAYNNVTRYVPSGVDTTIRIARTSAVSGAKDSVDVIIPNYVEWDEGPSSPSLVSDRYNLTAKLTYGLGRGSKLDLTYNRNRDQNMSRGTLSGAFNPDSWSGGFSTANVTTLGGYFMVAQTSESQLALDLKASYQSDWGQSGYVTRDYQRDHLSPFAGFNFKGLDFVMDPDEWQVTDKLINASRSGLLSEKDNVILPKRADLAQRQGYEGVSDVLRVNPYGLRSSFPLFGIGNQSQSWNKENRWYFTANADWQMNRFNRVWFGGDITTSQSQGRTMPLYLDRSIPFQYEPKVGGAFIQDRLDLGDVVLEAGVRMDYFDPASSLSRIPGYVFTIPDSLKGDFYTVEQGDGPVLDRLIPLEDCGGAATASRRTNADGVVVCKDNFIPAKTRKMFSPKLAVSFPVTASSTFRLSYGKNAQAPRLTGGGGIFASQDNDLYGGNANTNTTYGRDVEIPSTVLFEAGYRQVFGGNTVVDVAGYSKTNRNALAYRKVRFKDPVTNGDIYINSLQNADYSLARGFDLRFDRRLSELADLSVSYSFLDARGTGSDPSTYTNILLRSNTNLSILTGAPVESPEVLQTLDQSRAHTLAGTFSLTFGGDYAETSRLANAILADLGVYATMRVASGLPYTRLQNDANGQSGPPTAIGQSGQVAEALNASRTPIERRFDLRLTKGFDLMGKGARIFADFRNPLGLTNQDVVWLETGTAKNEAFRAEFVDELMRDATLDGDITIDNFLIGEGQTNAVNTYMLKQAETRYGDGDGTFTVAEQRNLFNSWYNLTNGTQFFRSSDRALRLGFEFIF